MVWDTFQRLSGFPPLLSTTEPTESHKCGIFCLGPLTFHTEVMGDNVVLCQGARYAKRVGQTFRNGLVFSSRPVIANERVRLRVELDLSTWVGALRVGFTTVPPGARTGPLPALAIPDLTNTPGHWASPLPSSTEPDSELEFWFTKNGRIHFRRDNGQEHRLKTQIVDLSKPLWAMIDVYGQTRSIFLLGSKKKGIFTCQKACPAPKLPPALMKSISNLCSVHNEICPSVSLCENKSSFMRNTSESKAGDECVVCMTAQANITLCCGHRCLCNQCTSRIIQDFGTCPLCRHEI